jgi:glycosyltransferase involved in cell wall biosynthesis
MKDISATIMIPAYNAEKFIGDSLESAANQTYKENYEILIVNDGSTDDTQGKIEWYYRKYDNIRLITQENQGTSSARNKLLEYSKGKILFGLDADDELHPQALEKIIDIYNRFPQINHIYTDQAEIDEKGEVLRERKRKKIHRFSDELAYNCHFQGHLKSFRKDFIGDQKFDENLKSAVDWDFFLKLHPNMTISHFSEVLYSYRMNQEGISFSKRPQVIQNSVNLIKKYVKERGIYNKDFEVVPVNVGGGIHYYDHLIDGKSTMNPKAREVLLRYLKGDN